MGSTTSILKPQVLTEFRRVNIPIEDIDIPARPESRSVTDKKGFYIFGIPLFIFLVMYIYTLAHSDIRRLQYDYDNCGNMCGQNNPKVSGISCSGADYTSKEWSTNNSEGTQKRCVAFCPDGTRSTYMPKMCEEIISKPDNSYSFGNNRPKYNKYYYGNYNNNYYRKSDLNNDKKSNAARVRRALDFGDASDFDGDNILKTFKDLRAGWWRFILVVMVAIVLSLTMLYLMRLATAVLVWSVLIFSISLAIGTTLGFCYAWYKSEEPYSIVFMTLTASFALFTIIILALLVFLFKKIRLIILLLEEAAKALFAMPLLIFIPILTTLLILGVLAVYGVSTTWMITARELHQHSEKRYEYEMNFAMWITVGLNFVMTIWGIQFIAGFQYMTLAGAVALWFFCRNKQDLRSPIQTSISNTVRFHLGTIAFGSFLLTLVAIVKAMIRQLLENDKSRATVEWCCSNIEAFLKFLSKNAYIETAIHGQPFFRSGKRAAKLLVSNLLSVIAINCIGDFVLGMIQFIIAVVSTGVAVLLFKDFHLFWLPCLICFLVCIIIAAMFIGIFNTIIDSLFICFCEDNTINDGVTKPYFMSKGLMEFVKESKKVYAKKEDDSSDNN